MQAYRTRQQPGRPGFTFSELLVVITVGAIMALAVSSLMVTAYRTFSTEMRQNEVVLRNRQLIAAFSEDAQAAIQVVYVGPGPFTPPTLSGGQSYSFPNNASGQPQTSMPTASKLVVFQLFSYDSRGIIPLTFDYVGYGWSQANQTVVRTCIRNSLSLRPVSERVVPEGGNYNASLSIQLHIASSFVNPTGTSYADNVYDINAVDGGANSLFQGAAPIVGIANVDEVVLDSIVSATTWGQNASLELKSNCKLRNWRQT